MLTVNCKFCSTTFPTKHVLKYIGLNSENIIQYFQSVYDEF